MLPSSAKVAKQRNEKMECRYVTVRRFSELSGYTESAIYSKMNSGVWIEGVHYKRAPDGKPLMDMEEYYKWAEAGRNTPVLKRVANQ